jgi:tetratricopeptide (TPR) repeat protein
MRRRVRETAEIEALDPLRDFHGNRFERAVASFFYTVRKNARVVLLAGGAVVIVGLASLGWFIYREHRERKSLAAFEELLKNPVMAPGSGAEKVALQKLEKYEEEFTNTHARMRSGIRRVDLLVKTGEKEKAAELLLELSAGAETPEIAAYFAYRAGTIFENEKKYGKSEMAYSSAASRLTEEDPALALALFGQGRSLFLMGKPNDGRTVFKKLMEMKDLQGIEQIKLAIASFLIQQQSGK